LIGRERERRGLSDRPPPGARGGGGVFFLSGGAGGGEKRPPGGGVEGQAPLLLPGGGGGRRREPQPPLLTPPPGGERGRSGGRRVLGGRVRLSAPRGVLLRERGQAPAVIDDLALAEAVRGAFGEPAARQPTAVFLDDLQWGDDATLELLPSLAASVADLPLVL